MISTTPSQGTILQAPPTQIIVQFDEPVDLAQLLYQEYQQTRQNNLNAVQITGPGGPYYPRFESFDMTTDKATFLMLDGLPPGDYELHLSGAKGLTDLAGNRLVMNDFSGDYVVHFAVAGPARDERQPVAPKRPGAK